MTKGEANRTGTREDDWAPLRDAVPSFAARWDEFRRSSGYDPSDKWCGIIEFEHFIALRLEKGDEGPLFAVADAFESVYAPADDELEGLLRVGMLEGLIHAAEDHGADLVRLWLRLGPAGRAGWEAAYRYTHSGRDWEPPAAVLHPQRKRGGKHRKR